MRMEEAELRADLQADEESNAVTEMDVEERSDSPLTTSQQEGLETSMSMSDLPDFSDDLFNTEPSKRLTKAQRCEGRLAGAIAELKQMDAGGAGKIHA